MGTLGTNLRQPAYGEPERDERWYRYSVKCERTFAMRLEAAAKAAGKSVNAFVQAHFETILEAPLAAESFDPARFDAVNFSRRHALPVPAALVWKELRAGASAQGLVRATHAQIEEATGIPYGSIPKLLLSLKDAGLIEQLSGAGTKGAQYRVMG